MASVSAFPVLPLATSLRVGHLVRCHPEVFPNSGRSVLCIAKVMVMMPNKGPVSFLSLVDEFNPDEFEFALDYDQCSTLPRSSQEEVDAASIIWDRQHVAFVCEDSGDWLRGQADGLAFPTQPRIRVATPHGVKVVNLGNDDFPVITLFPVVAILLKGNRPAAAVPGTAARRRGPRLQLPRMILTTEELEDMHRKVYDRVTSCDVDSASSPITEQNMPMRIPNIPDILKDIIPIEEMPAASEVCFFVHPYHGYRCVSSVLHVVLHAHFNGRTVPQALVGSIGAYFCDDPKQAPTPSGPKLRSRLPAATMPIRVLGQPRVPRVSFIDIMDSPESSQLPPTQQDPVDPPTIGQNAALDLTSDDTTSANIDLAPDTTSLPEGYKSPRMAQRLPSTTPVPFHMQLPAEQPYLRVPQLLQPHGQSQPPASLYPASLPAYSWAPPLQPQPFQQYQHHAPTRPQVSVPVDPVDRTALASFMANPPVQLQPSFGAFESYESQLAQASADNAAAFMLHNRARRRAAQHLTLEEGWALYQQEVRHPRNFSVNFDEYSFRYWLSCDEYRSRSPTQLLTDFAAKFPDFDIIPHPGFLIAYYRMAFGSGQLSLWHFRKVSRSTLDTWNDKDSLSLTVFPAKLTPPTAGAFTSLADLRDALDNKHKIACHYGSATLQLFTHAAKTFFHQSMHQANLTDADTEALTKWFNLQFKGFATALYLDIQQRREPPLHVVAHHCFQSSSNRFADLLLQLQVHRTAHASTNMKAEVLAQVNAALGHQHGPNRAAPARAVRFQAPNSVNGPAPPSMPPQVERAIPKQNGLPCCLRNLTTRGCSAPLRDGKCGQGSLKKAHFVPTTLPTVVKDYIIQKWTALKPAHANL